MRRSAEGKAGVLQLRTLGRAPQQRVMIPVG